MKVSFFGFAFSLLAATAAGICEYRDISDLEDEGIDYTGWPDAGNIWGNNNMVMDPRGCSGVCANPYDLFDSMSPIQAYCECSWEYFGPECERSIWLIIMPCIGLGLFTILVCIVMPYQCRKDTRLKIPPGAVPGITSGALPHMWIDSVGLPPYRCPMTVGNNSGPVGFASYNQPVPPAQTPVRPPLTRQFNRPRAVSMPQPKFAAPVQQTRGYSWNSGTEWKPFSQVAEMAPKANGRRAPPAPTPYQPGPARPGPPAQMKRTSNLIA